MNISTLIQSLQSEKDKHGDIDVIRLNDGDWSDITTAAFIEAETFYDYHLNKMRIGVPAVGLS